MQHKPLAFLRSNTFLQTILFIRGRHMIKNSGCIRSGAALKIEPCSIRSLRDLSIILKYRSDIRPELGREVLTLGARKASSHFRLLIGLRCTDLRALNRIPGISQVPGPRCTLRRCFHEKALFGISLEIATITLFNCSAPISAFL